MLKNLLIWNYAQLRTLCLLVMSDKFLQTVWTQIRPDRTLGHDLDLNFLTLWEFFEKDDFENSQQTTKKHEKLPSRQELNDFYHMTSRLGVK